MGVGEGEGEEEGEEEGWGLKKLKISMNKLQDKYCHEIVHDKNGGGGTCHLGVGRHDEQHCQFTLPPISLSNLKCSELGNLGNLS